MGFIFVGFFVFIPGGLTGGMLQMFSHGLLTGGLFLLVGVLYDRAHTRDLDAFGGLGARVPVYAGFLTVFAMGSLGLPGLSGFVAEFVTLLGTFQVNLVQYKVFVALSCLGIVLGAGYLLWMIQKVLLGPLNKRWEKLSEINNREIFTLIPLLVLIIVIGIYPNSILQFISPSIQALVNHVGGVIQ
jgi:NADH-quinone oxidoreductase subunit M